MKFSFLFLLCFLSYSRVAEGQQVTWTSTNVASATQAQGFTYRLTVTPATTNTANPPVVITSVLCGGNPPAVQCSAPLPAAAQVGLVTGAKSELTAQDGASAESAKSAPFTTPANVPTALRLTP